MREHDFQKPEFSVVEKCPKCGNLSLSFRSGKLICTSCGFEEKIPSLE